MRSYQVRWWTSPPQMDLSPRTRVYVWGGRWSAICSNSNPYDLLLTYRFLSKDLWIFSSWCGGYPTWDSSMICGASAICSDLMSVHIFWKDSEDPGGACLSPSYTSVGYFSKARLLAMNGSPWPMTLSKITKTGRNTATLNHLPQWLELKPLGVYCTSVGLP